MTRLFRIILGIMLLAVSFGTVQADTTSTSTMTSTTTSMASSAMAMPMVMPANCGLGDSTIAFCDSFKEGPYTGSQVNRGGDLDPTKWSFSRLTEGEGSGTQLYNIAPATAMFCQTPLAGVLPPRDSFMCNGTNGVDTTLQGNEDMHWMTTVNDTDNYAANGARILQPFDFANRTGTVSFMVDAHTRGTHDAWPDIVISDQPIQDAHVNKPGVGSFPRNGIEIDFNAGCDGVSGAVSADGVPLSDYNGTTVGQISTFSNYVQKDVTEKWPWPGTCMTTLRDSPNHIVVKISTTSLDVYGANHGTDNLIHLAHVDQTDGYNLGFTRGYVALQQAQYAAEKFNNESTVTYHWHMVGFDGPILPADRDYEIDDANTPTSITYDGMTVTGVNIGYRVQGTNIITCCDWTTRTTPFVLKGVDLSNAVSAFLTFNWREDNTLNPGLQVRLNGGAWRDAVIPPGGGSFTSTNALAAIPLSDLRAGDNTLEFNAPNTVAIANIDLAVQIGEAPPTATATSTPTTTPTATPTTAPTATPTSTPTVVPTDTPTSVPTATPTTVPTATATTTSSETVASTTVTSQTTAVTSTSQSTATSTTETWSTTIQVPAADGGHSIPVACTANPADWHTLDCKAQY